MASATREQLSEEKVEESETSQSPLEIRSAIFCGHANEVPHICDCLPNCYCKQNTCLSYRIVHNPYSTAILGLDELLDNPIPRSLEERLRMSVLESAAEMFDVDDPEDVDSVTEAAVRVQTEMDRLFELQRLIEERQQHRDEIDRLNSEITDLRILLRIDD